MQVVDTKVGEAVWPDILGTTFECIIPFCNSNLGITTTTSEPRCSPEHVILKYIKNGYTGINTKYVFGFTPDLR